MKKSRGNRSVVSLIRLAVFVLLAIISIETSYAQFSVGQTRKGVYGAKKKFVGKQQGKKNKHYKPTTKSGKAKYKQNKKRVKKRNHQKNKRNNYIKRKRKHSLKGRSKSLYGHNTSKRKSKGRYPKRKSDMSSKLGVTVFTGMVLTGQNEQLNSAGQPQNLFANYQPAPSLGLGLEYNHTSNLSFGANFQVLPLSKENFKVRALTLTIEAKYYLGDKRSKFKPYGVVGLTYSFAGINQDGYYNERSIENGKLDETYSVQDESHILVERIEREEPEIQTGVIPMFGYKLGLGADYKINQNLSVFGEFDYQSSFAKSRPEILEYYPSNTSNFNFFTFKVGLKMNLMKSKSLY